MVVDVSVRKDLVRKYCWRKEKDQESRRHEKYS